MKIKNPQKLKQWKLHRRKGRVRARISGTPEVPRLSAARSLTHITAQLIDDSSGRTLAYADDRKLQKNFEAGDRRGKVARAYEVGRLLAEKAKKAGITKVIFDRGGRQYHGRVQALAEGARDGGLIF